jgi:hypothetical protein
MPTEGEKRRALATPPSSPAHTVIALEHDFEWNMEEALNTALVPAEAVRLLVAQVEGLA